MAARVTSKPMTDSPCGYDLYLCLQKYRMLRDKYTVIEGLTNVELYFFNLKRKRMLILILQQNVGNFKSIVSDLKQYDVLNFPFINS